MIRTFVFGALAACVMLAGTAWAGPGASGHGHVEGHHDDDLAFGEPGDPKQPSREIIIVMKEEDGMMLFSPNAITVSQRFLRKCRKHLLDKDSRIHVV